MTWFNALVEVETPEPTDGQFDILMDQMEDYYPAIGLTDQGYLSSQISLQAVNLRQASNLAIIVLRDALDEADLSGFMISINVLTEEEFLRQENTPDNPEIIGTAKAAEILKVSSQRVVQLANRLNATKIGKTYAFPRKAVELAARRQAAAETSNESDSGYDSAEHTLK